MRPLIDNPDRTGIFLDFDGTLSEIVERPEDARPVAGAREVLTRLARTFRLLAVVSGRSAGQLVTWLGPEVEIWGIHGAERSVSGTVELTDRARPYVDLMARVRGDAEAQVAALGLDGVTVENKGVMLGLHYRAATDRARAHGELTEIVERLASEYGLLSAAGKMALELRPPIEFSKAQVVLQRARAAGLEAAAFAGDDSVDLPAFDALDMLERDGTAAVRIAIGGDETPPELIERADVVVDGPLSLVTWLRGLASAVPGPD